MNSSLSMARFRTLAFAVTLVVALASAGAFGQAISGSLVGTVVDSSGAAVANADVTALKIATGIATSAKTGDAGVYHFDNLPAGTYKITAKAAGFQAITEQVEVEVNKAGTVNLTLTPGAASETVEVSGTAAAIDTTTAQLATTFNTRMSQDLGLTSNSGGLGGGVQNLSLLSPGVTNANAMGDGMGPAVGGQRPRDNNFTIEGVDNNNKSVTGALAWVPNDAVDNFTLLANQFDAEFGHSSGGQFNTTIRTGTNTFHGSLYEYFRNRNMNALDNTYVLQGLTSNPRYDSNRYGGTFGGPIIKNKLFFFTLFDHQYIGLTGTGGGTVDAPTAAGLAAIATDPTVSTTNLGVFQQYVPVAPAALAGAAGCIQYNGLISGTNIPISSSSQFVAPANGQCAAGSVEVGPVSISAPGWDKFQDYVQSVDYDMSDKDQIRGRFVWNKWDQIDTNANLAAFYLPQSYRYYLFTVGEYHTFTPSLLNEFRVGFNRYANVLPASGSFKFPGLAEFPNLQFFDLGAGLQVGPDTNAPSSTIQNLYQTVDNVSWTKGRHTFKFGGEYRWFISPQQFTQRERGDYEYNTTQIFLEDFSPDNFGERGTGKTVYYGNQKAVYGYANDNWHVTQHLNLNLGVRYEFTTLPLSEGQQILNSVSNEPSIIVSQVNEPLVFGKPTVPTKSWAPRLGFAYSPGSSATTSIRGGFGMAYDTLYDNIGTLAVPPQIGSTNDVASFTSLTPGFLAGGGLAGGGAGITALSPADARAETANWIPPQIKWPYSINWTLGVQHAFGKSYTAEVNYVGTRGVHLDVQDQINRQALVNSSNFLPTYLQMPSQAQLDGLTSSLDALTAAAAANGEITPAFLAAGLTSKITADLPLGSSSYNGLETSLIRRFSNGLMFQSAYTWSHDIDNATADFHSSDLTPRRPQDFSNFAAERATSALSRAQRLTVAVVYDLPYFKQGNWLMQNVVGNWSFSPVYTYESPEYVTVQSTQDANFNGDAAGDRAILNPHGTPGTGSDVIPLLNTGGDTVAYCACGPNDNPNAEYIRAGRGALADTGRNTLPTAPTNDMDFGVYKNLNITERVKFRLGGQFSNIFNHPQYLPNTNPGEGLGVNDVASFNSTGGNYQSYVTPGNANFDVPKAIFSSNSRTIAIVGKIMF